MKLYPAILAILGSLAFASETTSDTQEVKFEKQSIDIAGHPESVAVDAKGNIYFTCIGETIAPTEKDGDGYIGIIPYGSTEVQKVQIIDALNAPKGLLIDKKGRLIITDVDDVCCLNPESGMAEGSVVLASMRLKYLNDIAYVGNRLLVSATDTNQIFYVDLQTESFGELIPKEPIFSPNGIAWDPEKKLIYICEYATDKQGKPNGRLLSINPVTREVTELTKERGLYDGLVYHDGELYFSDWSKDKKPEAIRCLNLKMKKSRPVATSPIEGAADFIIHGDMLIVPGLKEKKIHIMPLRKK